MDSPFVWAAIGYLLGSIPFGLLVARWGGAGDIRQIGSGNIGTTNVLRTGRKGLAAVTLALDIGKGVLAVLLARWFAGENMTGIAGGAAFLGHIFPVWLKFKGGKGVATMLGVSLAILWQAGVAFAAVWVLAALVTRYSSLGGMLGAVAAPVTAALLGHWSGAFLFAGMAIVLLLKHGENIRRLLKGTEPRIGASEA